METASLTWAATGGMAAAGVAIEASLSALRGAFGDLGSALVLLALLPLAVVFALAVGWRRTRRSRREQRGRRAEDER